MLWAQHLLKAATDTEIIPDLGDIEPYILLSEFYWLLAQQPAGEGGYLHTDGTANLGYIRDESFVPRAVSARWHFKGWFLSAYPIDLPALWVRGDQLIRY